MLGVIAEEPLSGHDAVLVAHLDGEVGARINGVGLAVGVWDLVHVDFVEDDLDADATAALGVVDEDEFAAFAVWELAEEVVVGWALLVDVVG